MIRKLVTALVLIALAVALVSFAVANRQSVVVSFDPFDQADPALVLSVPLYQVAFGVLVAGVLVGGCAAWVGQSKWRRRARWLEAEARARARSERQGGAPLPPAGLAAPARPPRLTIPPSAA